MNASLSQPRCLHHSTREAAARCPECAQFFCRECITEHEDRVICSACLARLVHAKEKPQRSFAHVWQIGAAFLGVFVAWMFFFLIGKVLVATPTDFHEGAVWQETLRRAAGEEP